MITGPVANFIDIPVIQELGFLRIDSTDRPILKFALLSLITFVSRLDLLTLRLASSVDGGVPSKPHFSLIVSKVSFEDTRSPTGRTTVLLPLNFIEPLVIPDFLRDICSVQISLTSPRIEGCGEVLQLLLPR